MVGGRGLGRWISHSLPLAPSVCLGARVRVASLCGGIVWSGGGCLTCGELAVLCCVAFSRRTCVLSVDAPSMQLCGAVGTCGEMTAPKRWRVAWRRHSNDERIRSLLLGGGMCKWVW